MGEKLDFYLYKNQFQIKNINVKSKTLKFSEESMEYLYNLKVFLGKV